MDMNNKTCYTSGRKSSYEELTLADDFMFCKIMQKERFCKELLEIILGVEIEKLVYHDDQKVFRETIDGKGIRLDVYVKDENHTIYDLEMQTTNTRELPKRTRYYHSTIDRGHLMSGEKYNKLNDTYVIFICTFDLFGKGYGKYTFKTMCEENKNIKLQDGRYTIFVNASGIVDDKKLQDFLNYINNGTVGNSKFIQELDREVQKNSSNTLWKEEYNMLLAREEMLLEEGVQKGIEKQKQEMYNSFVAMLNNGIPLYQILNATNDPDDFKKWLSERDNRSTTR
mgnify:CR=1 FL=1|jgi:predicted transposase/invertase (TIGR01784 family)